MSGAGLSEPQRAVLDALAEAAGDGWAFAYPVARALGLPDGTHVAGTLKELCALGLAERRFHGTLHSYEYRPLGERGDGGRMGVAS